MSVPFARHISGSTFAAIGLVGAAGAFAWFGMSGGVPQLPRGGTDAEQVTLPAPVPVVEEETVYGTVSTGGLPTRIVVPGAGVDASIVEVGVVLREGEAVWETAWHAAGHHMDSALPGQPGNMVISGHVSVANRNNLAVFRDLNSVVEGDVVEVYSGDDLYRYTVSRVFTVSPAEVGLLRSTAGSTVTLITCTKDLKHRLVVIGTLTDVVSGAEDA